MDVTSAGRSLGNSVVGLFSEHSPQAGSFQPLATPTRKALHMDVLAPVVLLLLGEICLRDAHCWRRVAVR